MKTLKVLIADDEPAVREGLKVIIDWERLGFSVCAEAGNGKECLEKMISINPDLVLLDIRMPVMHGLEVAQEAISQGFDGKIIIISGYSDFQYAKAAIRFGVNNYLLKPIDEEELEAAVKSIKNEFDLEQQQSERVNHFREKAWSSVLSDLLRGAKPSKEDAAAIEKRIMTADSFRVVAVEGEKYDKQNPYEFLYRLFPLSGTDRESVDAVRLDGRSVYLIKGKKIIKKIDSFAHKIQNRADDLLKLGIFAAQGRTVESPEDIYISYNDAKKLIGRQFFYPKEICFATGPEPHSQPENVGTIGDIDTHAYTERLLSCIEAGNAAMADDTVDELCDRLYYVNAKPEEIRSYLSSILIQIKHIIHTNFEQLDNFFESDSEIITAISSSSRLYEAVNYIKTKLSGIISVLGFYSKDQVIKKMIAYIEKNYAKSLKLEMLGQLFGYNSAYLGKLFKSNVGESFNTYLERVRINNAQRMLREGNHKVYEISKDIGFKNVDYFYKKFKKYVGESPSEYRGHHE